MPRECFIDIREYRLDELRLSYRLATFRPEHFSSSLVSAYAPQFSDQVRRSVPQRQAEFLAGRLCASSALCSYGYDKHIVGVGRWREPLWPESLVGSITHSNRHAAAIVAPRARFLGVGIDIETVVAESTREALQRLVVSAQEIDLLHKSCTGLDFDCLLTLAFSAKESFFKAAFPRAQRYFDFDAVEIRHVDAAARCIELRVTQGLGPGIAIGRTDCAIFDLIDSRKVITIVACEAPARGPVGNRL